MTGWLIFVGLALIVAGLLWRFGRLPKGGIELVAATLFLAVAGYAWQGSPGLSGKPTPAPETAKVPDSAFALERDKLLAQVGSDADVLSAADAFHRQGSISTRSASSRARSRSGRTAPTSGSASATRWWCMAAG
ncbi:hypothetical protein ACFSTI_02900 [Rhizorhabdus histidinilytica]